MRRQNKRCREQMREVTSHDNQRAARHSKALEELCAVLQGMSKSQRYASLSSLAPSMCGELEAYMEQCRGRCKATPRETINSSDAKATDRSNDQPHRDAASFSIVKTYHFDGYTKSKYQASIHVKGIRLYTPEQNCFDAAITHQMVLVEIRSALISRSLESPNFWQDHEAVMDTFHSVLRSFGTTENDLGVRAWVHMRTPRWLGSRVRIASQASCLAHTLTIHSRLLRARDTSWEALKAEWVLLLQRGSRCLTQHEAERIANKARDDTLKDQLRQAVKRVQKTVDQRLQRARQRARRDDNRGRVQHRSPHC